MLAFFSIATTTTPFTLVALLPTEIERRKPGGMPLSKRAHHTPIDRLLRAWPSCFASQLKRMNACDLTGAEDEAVRGS